MISLAFLDVDGVIVGERHPLPSPKTLSALSDANKTGTKIILTTAKPNFSEDIRAICQGAELANYHITFAGGLISNPFSQEVLQKATLDKRVVLDLRNLFLKELIFTEFETSEAYYLQVMKRLPASYFDTIAGARVTLFGKKYSTVFLEHELPLAQIVKIIVAANDDVQKKKILDLLTPYQQYIDFQWAQTPQTGTTWWGMITTKGISKRSSVKKVSEHYGVRLSDCLAVGDSVSDWEFMELCGYKATVKNAPSTLQTKLRTSKKSRTFVGPSTDEEGIVTILQHFINKHC